MNRENTSVFYNGLVWGLIIGFVSIIYYIVSLYMFDQYVNQALGYAGILIPLVILVVGLRIFRDNVRNGVITFETALLFGGLAILISVLLLATFNYILMAVVDPDLPAIIMDMQMKKAIARGATHEQIEHAYNMSRFKPIMTSYRIFVSRIFFGIIIALVVRS
jgi:hypothetical protein